MGLGISLKPLGYKAAGALIVTEAGGTVSGINSSIFNMDKGEILASNGLIHKEMLVQIKSATN